MHEDSRVRIYNNVMCDNKHGQNIAKQIYQIQQMPKITSTLTPSLLKTFGAVFESNSNRSYGIPIGRALTRTPRR